MAKSDITEVGINLRYDSRFRNAIQVLQPITGSLGVLNKQDLRQMLNGLASPNTRQTALGTNRPLDTDYYWPKLIVMHRRK